MFKLFSSGSDDTGSWPVSKIVAALESHYGRPKLLGEDGPLRVYGVEDNGVNFVVALMQTAPGSGKVSELGFLARFVGFTVTVQTIESLNRNMHVSVASLEGADLFLMAGLQITGAYDDAQFAMLLNAWRRDLMLTLHGLSGDSASMASAFPAAQMAAARDFAVNAAPTEATGEGTSVSFDMLSSFLGAESAAQEICEECNGRGKRGLIARMCIDCDGDGFVRAKRR